MCFFFFFFFFWKKKGLRNLNINYTPNVHFSAICWRYGRCKDQVWLESRIGMDPGPQAPNNKFVEFGRKNSSESRIKILDYSVRRKELYAYIYTKNIIGHALIFWLRVLNSFILLLSLKPFCPFSYYILWLFYHFLHPRVGQVLEVLFFFYFSCLFLNLPFLAVRMRVHCSGIISTLMRLEG